MGREGLKRCRVYEASFSLSMTKEDAPGCTGTGRPSVERRPFSLFVTVFPERFLIQGGVPCGNDGVGECLFRVPAAFLRQGLQEFSVLDEPFAVGGHLVQVSLRSDQPRPSVQNRFRNSSRPEGNGRGFAGHGFQRYVGKRHPEAWGSGKCPPRCKARPACSCP